jgi:hypothetical protein
MKNSLKLITASLLFSLTISCGGWSEKDKEIYLTECKRAKLDSTFCDCSLKKIVEKYTSFEEAMRHEEEFPEILISCKK